MEESLGIYEMGYHLLPNIEEAVLDKSVSSIKDAIVKDGSVLGAEESPKLTSLSYPISKDLDGGRDSFDKAYFGWVKFESAPSNIKKISDSVSTNKDVLRFIIVEAEKENNVHYHKATPVSKQDKPDGDIIEIDKSIEDLVIA